MNKYETYCGLYCGACLARIANETGKVEELAAKLNIPVEKAVCNGCKSGVNLEYCEKCKMKACCKEKGYRSCAECEEVPCALVQSFSQEMPHRKAVIRNLSVIKDKGLDQWLTEQADRWKCPECGQRFGWYSGTCSQCGAEVYDANKECVDLQEK